MDGYCTMYYIALDHVSAEERDLRILLADYHAKKNRVNWLNALGLSPAELPQLEKEVGAQRADLETHRCLPTTKKEREAVLDGKKPLLRSNTEICKKAGIERKYYKPHFDYLSNYTHGYPISLEQIQAISCIEDVLALLIPVLHVCSGYLCFAIRDFIKLFPDQASYVNSFVRQTITGYEKEWCLEDRKRKSDRVSGSIT